MYSPQAYGADSGGVAYEGRLVVSLGRWLGRNFRMGDWCRN